MKAPARRHFLLLAGAAVLPPLAGCGGLLPAPPERQIYRLAPAIDRTSHPARADILLLVATPTAAAGIDTKRIALIRSAVTLDYFADAEWTDRPPFLVKAAAIQGLERSRAFAGVSSEGLGLNADYVLNIDLREFTAVYTAPNAPPHVKIHLDAELVTMRGRTIVAETTLRREAAATGNDMPAIVVAFDQALGAIIGDLVAWTSGNPGLSPRRK